METRSAAQLYALIFGVVLVAVGVIGFFYEASFAVGDSLARNAAFGILDVNGWHNLVHVLTGAIGLAVVGSRSGARTYALVFGTIYVVIAVWGFASPGQILSLLPINFEDSVLHALIGIAGLGAYSASRDSSAVKAV